VTEFQNSEHLVQNALYFIRRRKRKTKQTVPLTAWVQYCRAAECVSNGMSYQKRRSTRCVE